MVTMECDSDYSIMFATHKTELSDCTKIFKIRSKNISVRDLKIFSPLQTDLSLTSSVSAGAELAIKECAAQFSSEVWNCPVTAFR